ncbi:MAG: hypothetical protein MZV70_13545 [Desulfobacterales bacterium]|nr:hypothetical protein [Desulfobacterales bacterium]
MHVPFLPGAMAVILYAHSTWSRDRASQRPMKEGAEQQESMSEGAHDTGEVLLSGLYRRGAFHHRRLHRGAPDHRPALSAPGGPPDRLSQPFQPKPEWYFLWLFQLVRYFPGRAPHVGRRGRVLSPRSSCSSSCPTRTVGNGDA